MNDADRLPSASAAAPSERPAARAFSREQLQRRILELGAEQAWNHAIELPHGVWTAEPRDDLPGKNLPKWRRLQPSLDALGLAGLRVLDLGCNEGYFSIQVSRAGAREVVACDIGAPRLEKARFVLDVLGVTNVDLRQVSVYEPAFDALGRFDLALCLGFLHRVPDPFGVLQKLAAMADVIVLEWKSFALGTRRQPLLLYDGRLSVADDPYSRAYFRPSMASVAAMLEDCQVRHHRLVAYGPGDRVILVAGRAPLPASLPDARPGRANRLATYGRWFAARVRDVLGERDR